MISSTSGANINAEIIIPACLTAPDFLMMLLHLEVRIPKKNKKKKWSHKNYGPKFYKSTRI